MLVVPPQATLRTNATTIALRLTGDTWLPNMVEDVFQGLTARQADPSGWNAIVHPALTTDHAALTESASQQG